MSANSDGPLVKVRDLRKRFGQNEVLRGVDLDVARGEVVSVIGASGSGKTTMLRCVNLLETYDSGSITVDGVEVGYSGEGPARRRRGERELARIRADIGMVFQLFNLFPHLTARENVMLGLRKVRGLAQGRGAATSPSAGSRASASPTKRDSLPYELSGGQQQRVGIARAVAMKPKAAAARRDHLGARSRTGRRGAGRGARTGGRGHDDDPASPTKCASPATCPHAWCSWTRAGSRCRARRAKSSASSLRRRKSGFKELEWSFNLYSWKSALLCAVYDDTHREVKVW